MKIVESWMSYGGHQSVCAHRSATTGTDMTFSVYIPPHQSGEKLPVVWYLSGLTCTHANVTEKGEFRRACSELGLIFVAPDTSPRGDKIADDEAYDLGTGAGFYVDATQDPWAEHYQMRSYIEDELPDVLFSSFPADEGRQSMMGHSMGGHGALTIGLRNADRFRSLSALAPIVSPLNSAFAAKALTQYLGPDKTAWRAYDTCALIEDGARGPDILVDQGTDDEFLENLKPELLENACRAAGQPLTLRHQKGYGHSYYFISTFMSDHLQWHAERLKR